MFSQAQLLVGLTAKLYERRIANFLATEMVATKPDEVEATAKKIGGNTVGHPNATWSFEMTPFNGVRLRAVYWQENEDMPSGATLLIGKEAMESDLLIEAPLAIIKMTVNRFFLFYQKETERKLKLFHSLLLLGLWNTYDR